MKWWVPARYFGLHHKSRFFGGMTRDGIRDWKREQSEKGMYRMVVQPRYEKIVRLGPMRYGMTVRLASGKTAVHELLGQPR